MATGNLGRYLESVSDERSWIELGAGTGTWDELAEAVFKTNLLEAAGWSERELVDFMTQLAKLVVAFASFAHEAVTNWLGCVDQDVLAVTTAVSEADDARAECDSDPDRGARCSPPRWRVVSGGLRPPAAPRDSRLQPRPGGMSLVLALRR